MLAGNKILVLGSIYHSSSTYQSNIVSLAVKLDISLFSPFQGTSLANAAETIDGEGKVWALET